MWAGIVSGAVFLAIAMTWTAVYVGSPWIMVRLVASVVMGAQALPPPATFDLTISIVALVVHLLLSIGFACLLAIIIHRWGMLVGIAGGALFGLALYVINFYTFTAFFPWFFPMRSWIMVVGHVAFGALAGGIYEALEVEEFVPAEA